MLCYRCGGSGRYMGNGMMMTDCDLCDDSGTPIKDDKPKEKASLAMVNRKGKSYQAAIKDIMSLNPDISRTEAAKMFDEAFDKA